MSTLPFHPRTGLQAIGFTRRGPVWPVMGGSEDADADSGQEPGQQQQEQSSGGGSDRGFPANTPVAEMSHEQQAAYYKHQNRQTDNKLAAFKGVTPQQVQEFQARISELETAALSTDERALKDATDKAASDARAAADAEWLPKFQQAQLRSIAATVLTDKDQLDAFMVQVNPGVYAGDSGEIDTDKVMGQLTALFGGNQQLQQQQQRQWGQHSGVAGVPTTPGAAGKAEAQKRFGVKT